MEHFAGTGLSTLVSRWVYRDIPCYPDYEVCDTDRSNGSLMLSAALKRTRRGGPRFAGSTWDGDMVMTVAGVERDC